VVLYGLRIVLLRPPLSRPIAHLLCLCQVPLSVVFYGLVSQRNIRAEVPGGLLVDRRSFARPLMMEVRTAAATALTARSSEQKLPACGSYPPTREPFPNFQIKKQRAASPQTPCRATCRQAPSETRVQQAGTFTLTKMMISRASSSQDSFREAPNHKARAQDPRLRPVC
jgi:hypothetical protein